jgi:hypothetical protein
MIVRRSASPSAEGAAVERTESGVDVCMLRAERIILQPVCMEVVTLSSFRT